jgi:hypothetical protein
MYTYIYYIQNSEQKKIWKEYNNKAMDMVHLR